MIVDSPGQKLGVPEIVGIGEELVLTFAASVPVQPLASVTVTVYVPDEETVIEFPFVPLDQL